MSVPVNSSHQDDHTQPTNEMTPGLKPFTRVGMPHRPRNAFRLSLALFSVCLMLRAPVASSEKKTITFGRRVSSIQTTCPIHRSCAIMITSSMPRMSALRSTSVHVLETFSSQENAHDLAKASEVKLIECFQLLSFELLSLTAIGKRMTTTALQICSLVRTVVPRFPHTRVHNLPKEVPALASLLNTSLSMNAASWSHCAPQVLEAFHVAGFCALDLDFRLWRSKSWCRLQQPLRLQQAYGQTKGFCGC